MGYPTILWDQMAARQAPCSLFLVPQRGSAHPEAGQVALQLLVEQEVDGQRVAGPVGEHGVDDIAVLVAQLLSHVQQDALAQVLQVDPAQGEAGQEFWAVLSVTGHQEKASKGSAAWG